MGKKLTEVQKATNYDTMMHKQRVTELISKIIIDLWSRANTHDNSKLADPELDLFVEYTPKLAKCTFGSDEYKRYLKELKPALDHHYANNRHHPEHFKNGISEMNLIDLLEMFADWKAASERHNDGNIRKSIQHNGERFDMSNQLIKIFENTIEVLDK